MRFQNGAVFNIFALNKQPKSVIQYIPQIHSAVTLFRRKSERVFRNSDQFLGPAGEVWERVGAGL